MKRGLFLLTICAYGDGSPRNGKGMHEDASADVDRCMNKVDTFG
jgi:hypothetical protein